MGYIIIMRAMKKGVFTISIDVELHWGRHDRDWRQYEPAVKTSRSIIKDILELLEEYNIGATWAVVGHLFLDSCKTKRGIKHPEITPPHHAWHPDWFANDPCSSRRLDPGWYGRDIVRMIKKYPRQEIACHSFSHAIFGDRGCSRQCAESEVNACVALAKKEGVRLSSFVFPRNRIGHLDVLKEYGFTAYRGPESPKLIQLSHFLSPFPPPVSNPIDHGGILEIPPSMQFVPAVRFGRFIPNWLILKKAMWGIERAIDEKKIFHLWLHPEYLYWRQRDKISLLERIISYACTQHKQKNLEFFSHRQHCKKFPSVYTRIDVQRYV